MHPADVARLIAQYGETITLRREGTPNIDVAVKARITGFAPHELVGDLKQGDRRIIIANAEIAAAGWPGPPKLQDRLIVDGRTFTLTGVDTRKIGEDIAGHWIIARG